MFYLSKTQIDKLGDKLRRGPVSEEDLRLVDEYRKSFRAAYSEVATKIIQNIVHEQCIINLFQIVEMTGRPAKSTSALVEKLRRESIRLSQVQDIAGCRIVVEGINEQDVVVEALSRVFTSIVIADRRIKPSFGYRAVHGIINISGKLVEVQIRTQLQNNWAVLSEKLADEVDPLIKYGRGDSQTIKLLDELSRLVQECEHLEKEGVGSKDLKFRAGLLKVKKQIDQFIKDYISRRFG